jgi:hypothetical protein
LEELGGEVEIRDYYQKWICAVKWDGRHGID